MEAVHMAIAPLIIGIVGIATYLFLIIAPQLASVQIPFAIRDIVSRIYLLSGPPIGIIGLVLGIRALKRKERRMIAIAGIVLICLAFLIFIVGIIGLGMSL